MGNRSLPGISAGVSSHLFSALLGGVVSALVVLSVTGRNSPVNIPVAHANQAEAPPQASDRDTPVVNKWESLEVQNLRVTGEIQVGDEKADVVIRDGSIVANVAVASNKFIGTQYQGHIFVANRMFTTPDNLNSVPMPEWRFFTEIGSSNETGGEMILRSSKGATIVGRKTRNGLMLRAGFDAKDQPQFFATDNDDGKTTQPPFTIEPPKD